MTDHRLRHRPDSDTAVAWLLHRAQSNYILFSTLSGGMYFQEFCMLTEPLPWAMFIGGIAVMFSGLVLLAPPPPM